jgi:thiamine biosynthesis lipoprotein
MIIPLLFFITVEIFFVGCKPSKNDYVHLQGNAQGTTFSIKYESKGAKDYSVEIDSIFNVVNLSMSTYEPQSIISKLNNGDSTVIIDKHFAKVFDQSMQVYTETNGLFDPSIGILVNAYGFGPKKVDSLTETKRIELMQYVGFHQLSIQGEHLVKKQKETILDFNAIAQGYTVDLIGDFLKRKNCANYLVEIGGEVKAKGVNQDGKLWSIGIQNPEKSNRNALETILYLKDKSIATSGNYRKFKTDKNGKKFVHTINPLTGKNEPNNILSATVMTQKDCAFADAYATSLMVMGYEKSLEFLKNHPELEVFLIYIDNDGKTQIYSDIKEK